MFDRSAHHAALHGMIADRRPDLAVTLNLQRALDFYALQSAFGLFMNRMQSSVDGRRWHRIPGADRPIAIGMFEDADSNPHIHASMYAPLSSEPFANLTLDTIAADIETVTATQGLMHLQSDRVALYRPTGRSQSPHH